MEYVFKYASISCFSQKPTTYMNHDIAKSIIAVLSNFHDQTEFVKIEF